MLADIKANYELYFLILVVVIAAIVIIGGAIWGIVKAMKSNSPNKKKAILISLLFIVIAAVSWVLNIGWIRFIMTILCIPFIHAVIFFITNLFVSSYTDESKNIKTLNLLFCLTYLLSYIFLPDGGDVGGMYFFFRLIHNDTLSIIAYHISSTAFLGHIVFFILQLIQMKTIKKARKLMVDKKETETNYESYSSNQ